MSKTKSPIQKEQNHVFSVGIKQVRLTYVEVEADNPKGARVKARKELGNIEEGDWFTISTYATEDITDISEE